ncbi:hypothetical protein SOVF_063560, partial [Spinacia oleracea]
LFEDDDNVNSTLQVTRLEFCCSCVPSARVPSGLLQVAVFSVLKRTRRCSVRKLS